MFRIVLDKFAAVPVASDFRVYLDAGFEHVPSSQDAILRDKAARTVCGNYRGSGLISTVRDNWDATLGFNPHPLRFSEDAGGQECENGDGFYWWLRSVGCAAIACAFANAARQIALDRCSSLSSGDNPLRINS